MQTRRGRDPNRTTWSLARTAAALGACSLPSCGGGNAASYLARPPEFAPEHQTKCQVAASAASPLIVEWPAADRTSLEALAKRGVVAVRYRSCEMEVLKRCRVKGAYDWAPVTPKDERVRIRSADDLYAKFPVGAVRLEGKLATAGELNVDFTFAGRWQTAQESPKPSDFEGDCTGATHVITAMTAGAFTFYAGAAAEVGASAGVVGVGAGARSSAAKELLNTDGDKQACSKATSQDMEPPYGCGALIRLEVAPIQAAAGAAGLPSAGLRAVVSCGDDTDNLGKDALRVTIDDAPATASGEHAQMNVLEWVEYPATPGHHHVRVEADGCVPEEADVEIADRAFAPVQGHLARKPGDRLAKLEGPANLAGSNSLYQFGYSLDFVPTAYVFARGVSPVTVLDAAPVEAIGLALGTAYNWFTWELDGAYGRAPELSPGGALATDLGNEWIEFGRVGLRAALRLHLPYSAALLGSGVTGSLWRVGPPDGASVATAKFVEVPVWAGLEIKPLCDWGLRADSGYDRTLGLDDANPMNHWFFSSFVFYQANDRCSSETRGLRTSER